MDFNMHPQMKMGPVSLRINDLDLVQSFYVKDIGLKVLRRDGNIVELGAAGQSAEPLLILRHDPATEKAPHDAAGLYHLAILLPDRKSLAAAYLSLGNSGVLFDGFADHLVSEALYLTDPEGNGIEIYADRPRSEWKFDEDGGLQIGTQPLDIDSLSNELSGVPRDNLTAMPNGTRIGHVHLKVTELKRSINFYQGLLGLDLVSYWGSAAFLSAAGYHHHIGVNTWESLMGQTFKDGWAGLEHFTISIPDLDFVHKLSSRLHQNVPVAKQSPDEFLVSDPDGIKFLIQASK